MAKDTGFGAGLLARADKESSGNARWILLALAGVLAWSTYVLYETGQPPWSVYATGAIAAAFCGLAVGVRQAPLACIGGGLGIYLSLVALSAVIDPISLFQGLIVKGFVIFGLAGAYAEQRELKRGREREAACPTP